MKVCIAAVVAVGLSVATGPARAADSSGWGQREHRRSVGMGIGGGMLAAGGLTLLGSGTDMAVHCDESCPSGRAPLAFGVGAGLSVLGAVVLTTSAGLRHSGRADARHPDAHWAQRDDTWSRRMAAFGIVTGVGAAVAVGMLAGAPWTVCREDECDGGGGGVGALYFGAPIAALGLAGLGIMAAHRRAHRRAVELSFGPTGVSGRF